jgi:hypothetical protein
VNKPPLESIPIIHSDCTTPRESGTQDMTPVDNSSPSSRWVTREELDFTLAPIIQSNHTLGTESVQRMETTNHTLSETTMAQMVKAIKRLTPGEATGLPIAPPSTIERDVSYMLDRAEKSEFKAKDIGYFEFKAKDSTSSRRITVL